MGKESACNEGDAGSVPESGIHAGGGNGNPLQCSCLGNPMNRGAWQATVQGVTKSQTRLSDFHFHISIFQMLLQIELFSEFLFLDSSPHLGLCA